MNLRISNFIELKLSKAKYEYDDSVKQWSGWIKDFPGVYAQSDNIEQVRQELAETLEEWILISIQEKKQIKGLGIKLPNLSKSLSYA